MSDNWELFYWPGFAGRAEFVRLVFEEAGVKYTWISEIDTIRNKIILGQTDNFPAFAPPVVKNGSFELSQTPVICRYLGEKFGLIPDSEPDRAHAEQLNLCCHDYIAEGRLAFHGINPVGPYLSQKEATQPYLDSFIAERLPRWLKYFEQAVKFQKGNKEYLFGSKVTYADLALLHILRATESQFLDQWKAADYIPTLKAFKDHVSLRPNLAAYFKSDRCQPFAGDSMM